MARHRVFGLVLAACTVATCVLWLGLAIAQDRTVQIEGARVTLVNVGDPAPAFKLFGVDLKYHSLDMYRGKKAVAVIFHCNHCPISKRNVDRIVELGNKYQALDVQFLVVNPNPVDKVAADGFEQMQARAREKKFPFPYLYDETQQTAAAYGAQRTDHAFVLVPGEDASWRVAYIGPIDSRGEAPQYLADALDAVLAGRKIESPDVKTFGCTIKYRKPEERVRRFGHDPLKK